MPTTSTSAGTSATVTYIQSATNDFSPSYFWMSGAPKPSPQRWIQWRKSFENFLDIRAAMCPGSVLSASIKLKLLRAYLGEQGQTYYDSLVPDNSDSVETVLDLLAKHWGLRESVITARYKFTGRKQQPNESLEDYITALHKLGADCKYSGIPQDKFEDVCFLQTFIAGIADNKTRERLLLDDDTELTFEKACKIAQQRANAAKEARQYTESASAETFESVDAIRRGGGYKSRPRGHGAPQNQGFQGQTQHGRGRGGRFQHPGPKPEHCMHCGSTDH